MIPVRYILLIALPVGCLGAGYYWGSSSVPETETRIEERVVTQIEKQIEVQTVTEWKDRIVTVERVVHPDGTTEERTTTEDRDEHQSSQTETHESTSQTAETNTAIIASGSTNSQASYSLGVQYRHSLYPILDTSGVPATDYTISLGARVLSLPVWVELGASTRKELSVGVRYEW